MFGLIAAMAKNGGNILNWFNRGTKPHSIMSVLNNRFSWFQDFAYNYGVPKHVSAVVPAAGATAVAGPGAGAIVAVSQLFGVWASEYYRYRIFQAQVKLQRELMILKAIEQALLLSIALIFVFMFRKALSHVLRRIDVPALVKSIRSCRSCRVCNRAKESANDLTRNENYQNSLLLSTRTPPEIGKNIDSPVNETNHHKRVLGSPRKLRKSESEQNVVSLKREAESHHRLSVSSRKKLITHFLFS